MFLIVEEGQKEEQECMDVQQDNKGMGHHWRRGMWCLVWVIGKGKC